jgi:hypothetical protein
VPIAPMTGDIKLGPDKRAPDAAASYSEAAERFCLLGLGALESRGTVGLEYGGSKLGVLGPWATGGGGVRPEDRLV